MTLNMKVKSKNSLHGLARQDRMPPAVEAKIKQQ